jgi:tetratricopeptide (TPR) repeat protein
MPSPGSTGDDKQTAGAAPAEHPFEVAGPAATAAKADVGPVARHQATLSMLLRRPRLWVATAALLVLIACGLAFASPHLRAWYHLHAGRSALESYHNPQAVRHLQTCLAAWPDDAEVLLLAARAARRAQSYEEAERFLEKRQKARGLDDAGSFEQLLLAAERSVDQVADVCRRHVEQGHPDAPLILEALTRGYLRQYRLAEARYCLDRWLKSQPDNPQALCLQGLLQLDYQQARAAAVDTYRRAVQLDPEHEEARLGLAIALLEIKSFGEAVEHLEWLRERQPDNLRVQVGLAECRDGLGEGAAAVQMLDAVLARQPGFAPALSLRGRLARQNGEHEAAEAWLRQAVARRPGDYRARYNLSLCLRNNGKEAEAEEHKRQLKQMEDGLKRFNDIVTKDLRQRPRDAALHHTLGQLLLDSGYHEEGLRWLHSALRQDPGYAPARKALTDYYKKVKGSQEHGD